MEKNDAGLHSIVHKYKDMAKRFDTKKKLKALVVKPGRNRVKCKDVVCSVLYA